jgi:hypothetical protein
MLYNLLEVSVFGGAYPLQSARSVSKPMKQPARIKEDSVYSLTLKMEAVCSSKMSLKFPPDYTASCSGGYLEYVLGFQMKEQ